MSTDLAQHIAALPVIDTHEHLRKESQWVQDGPGDVLQDLFAHYAFHDLVSAGASAEAVAALSKPHDLDLETRWAGVSRAWEAMRHTGYGEAVRIQARSVYGVEELSVTALRGAQPRLMELRQPGTRLRLLRDVAHIQHVQTDDFTWSCAPDASGPGFFLYDLSWKNFCCGDLRLTELERDSGVSVSDLPSLRRALDVLFSRYAPCAIAVKTQHAYARTLHWHQRDDGDAGRALEVLLREPKSTDAQARLCLGDWCLARGVELATDYRLPIKIHTGYYAGNNQMPVERIRPGHLNPLLQRYPEARFVLMHTAYPYGPELIALAKHYANVWVDLCWAWSIDPYSTMDFLRRFLHAAPLNKLFGFGGDTFWPTAAYAYCRQMRQWLTRTLKAEIDAGDLTEAQAMRVASAWLHDNQRACFDLEDTLSAIGQVASAQRALATP